MPGLDDEGEIAWVEDGADVPRWYLALATLGGLVVALGEIWLLAFGGLGR